jgi:hypothetical protein
VKCLLVAGLIVLASPCLSAEAPGCAESWKGMEEKIAAAATVFRGEVTSV